MKKNIVFRLDCGKVIGSGHLMRCLALARTLKKINYQPIFVSYDFSKEIIERIIKKEFKIYYLNSISYKKNPEQFERQIFYDRKNINFKIEKFEFFKIIKKIKNIETIIVDHYGLSYDWEKFVKAKLKKKLVVIDDYFNIDQEGNSIREEFKKHFDINKNVFKFSSYGLGGVVYQYIEN